MGKEEMEWLSEHSKEVEKYSGKWIAFNAKRGILASGRSAREVLQIAKSKNVKSPSIFKIPRKDEEELILIIVVK